MTDIKELKSLAHGLRILYVEDDIEIRNSIGSYLHKIFSHVDIAENGKNGLEYFNKNQYDMVLTDILMPYMNGLEMSSEIKRIKPEQEIIIISAYSEAKYFLEAIRLGISGFIIKPVSYDQMNNTLYQNANKVMTFKENKMYKEHLEDIIQERTREIQLLEQDKTLNYENTLLAFVEMVEDRDTYTGGHSVRVANYCKLIAQKMGYDEETSELLYRAGILHDIGKVATPDSVLLKPGKLSDLEYKLIIEHVQVGYDLLSKIPMYKEISNIIKYHHERYDGQGYPNGIKGDDIPELARIMIVADSFDAMTTNRIYKGRKSNSEAINELKSFSGTQFHPEVVDSAAEVLLEIDIADSINQIPSTELEKERFAYFYHDQLTQAYNTDYLNFILNHNTIEKEYLYINVLFMHNFSKFNYKYGWEKGNGLLSDIVDYLHEQYPDSIIVRYHGDDFILITKGKLDIDLTQFEKTELFAKAQIDVSKFHINLENDDVKSLAELEALINTNFNANK